MIQIRQAEPRDASAVSDLYRQLVHPVAPDVRVDVTEDRIAELRADPHNFLFVLQTERIRKISGPAARQVKLGLLCYLLSAICYCSFFLCQRLFVFTKPAMPMS